MAPSRQAPKKKKSKRRDLHAENRKKGPAGTGRSRKRDRKIRIRAKKDLHEQFVLHQEDRNKRLRHIQHQEGNKEKEEGAKTEKMGQGTGFEQALAGATTPAAASFARYFWQGDAPSGGEPDDALKLQRKDLGVKVRGASIPPPVDSFNHPALPSMFSEFFKSARATKSTRLQKPTPIQAQVWPASLCGVDIIGIAPTGSGKTLAYTLPAIPHILGQKKEQLKAQSPICLVLAPTRELAKQVCDATGGSSSNGWFKRLFGLRASAVYGGIGKDLQLDNILSMGMPHMLCATPGRLLDLLGMAFLSLDKVTYLVLDEADRMLALGFEAQLNAIMKSIPPNRQVSLFSATFALKLQSAAEEWMSKERVLIRVATMQMDREGAEQEDDDENSKPQAKDGAEKEPKESENDTALGLSNLTVSPTIEQTVHVCAQHKKEKKLIKFLIKVREKDRASGSRQRSAVLIFCKEIKTLNNVANFLSKNGERCAPLHSGIPQVKREMHLENLKVGRIDTLVATDLASRGLHITRLRYVVNYDFPSNLAVYCHRIGRVGRQGAKGWAYSFFTRHLEPMAAGLVSLLERSKQFVDPNLRALAEGRQGKDGSDDDDDANDDQDDAASDHGDEKDVAQTAKTSTSEKTKAANELAKATLCVGGAVVIRGLEKSPQLNGSKGRITKKLAKQGRWEVTVDGTNEVRALRPRNLEAVPEPPAEEDAESDSGDDCEGSESSDPPATGGVGSGGGLRIQPSKKRGAASAEKDSDDGSDDSDNASKPVASNRFAALFDDEDSDTKRPKKKQRR